MNAIDRVNKQAVKKTLWEVVFVVRDFGCEDRMQWLFDSEQDAVEYVDYLIDRERNDVNSKLHTYIDIVNTGDDSVELIENKHEVTVEDCNNGNLIDIYIHERNLY